MTSIGDTPISSKGYKFFYNLLFVVYILSVLLFDVHNNDTVFIVSVGGISVLILLTQARYIALNCRSLLLWTAVFGLSALFFSLIQDRAPVATFRLAIQVLILCLLIRYRISTVVLRVFLYSYLFAIIYFVLIVNIDPNFLFATASRNYVGWHGLALTALYYLIRYRNGEKIELITAFITIVFSLLLIGRSTIMCSLLLFFGLLFLKYRQISGIYKFIFVLLLVGISIVIASYFSDFLEQGFQRFEAKSIDSEGRAFLFDSYLDKINVETFFVGVSPFQYPFFIYNNTLHNSYLWAHSNFGVLIFPFLIFLLWVLFYRVQTNLYLRLILVVLLIRAAVDVVAFTGWYDYIFFYIIYLICSNFQQQTNGQGY